MPLLKLHTSVPISDDLKPKLLASCLRILAQVTGKPEAVTMVVLENGEFLMGGKPGHAAFVDIRGIGGLTADVNKKLSEKLCDFLGKELGISPERIYITFTEVAASNWGWNGSTFG
jgi:phenylpyruvate tautomerase PptA (4-oxalocrotonate tautomerase family)